MSDKNRATSAQVAKKTKEGDEKALTNFLVGIESVDNQRQKLVDISGKGVTFGFSTLLFRRKMIGNGAVRKNASN
jgi:hypothetical protein